MEDELKDWPGQSGELEGLTGEALRRLEHRVEDYMAAYVAGAEDPAPYALKQVHTRRVCGHIRYLAESLALSPEIQNLSAATALVHDLGRFPQFQRYQTYSDALSRNHAALGAGAIRRLGLLEELPRRTRQIISRAVALHNRPELPAGLPRDLDLQARLLRDADKLDIFKVMVDQYTGPLNGSISFITLHFPDDGCVSPELAGQLSGLNRIPYNRIRSLNDLKLFQLSMIFDLNFPAAHAHVREQGVVPSVIRSMPRSDALGAMEEILDGYLESRAGK